MKTLLAIAAALPIWAQSGLDRPFVGEALDARGLLRPVFGIGGSFTTSEALASRVLSTACSTAVCLAKTDSALLSGNSSTTAPPGPAWIAIEGAIALVYFSQTQQFAIWQAGALSFFNVNVDGEVLSLQSGLKLAVRRDSGVWIVSGEGAILDSLPAEAGPVLLIEDGVVYATPDSIVRRRSDGSEIRFAAPGITALFQMGDGYVEAQSGAAICALRTAAGHEGLFLLPAENRKPGR